MIERLRLVDFKSFRDVSIPFGPLTLLVGTNASGKSNLRDALLFLKGIGLGYAFTDIVWEGYGLSGTAEWRGIRGGFRELPTHGQPRMSLGCTATRPAGGATPSQRFEHHLSLDFSDERAGPRICEERLSLSEPADEGTPVSWDVGSPRGQVSAALEVRFGDGSGRTLAATAGRSVVSQLVEQDHAPGSQRRAAAAYLDLLRGLHFIELDPATMRQPSPVGRTTLGVRGENLSSMLAAHCADPHRKMVLLDWLQALTPLDVTDLVFKDDFAGRTMAFLVEGNGSLTSAASASDGTLRFVAIVASLLGGEPGQTFVIEEIDAGIHPTRLYILLDLLERARQTRGIQVIATTHNPLMLTFLSEESRQWALLVHRHPEWGTSQVVRIMDLADIERVLSHDNLGELLMSGWLDDVAFFTAPEDAG